MFHGKIGKTSKSTAPILFTITPKVSFDNTKQIEENSFILAYSLFKIR